MFGELPYFTVVVILYLAFVIYVASTWPIRKVQRDKPENSVSSSALPQWDEEWETADPLRGKSGWEVRDYVNLAVASILIFTSIGLLVPAISIAREAEGRITAIKKLRDVNFELHERMDTKRMLDADVRHLP